MAAVGDNTLMAAVGDLARGFGGYVFVSISRAGDKLDVGLTRNLMNIAPTSFRADHIVIFAQGVNVDAPDRDAFKAGVERLDAEYKTALNPSKRADAIKDAAALAARFPVYFPDGEWHT